MRLWKRKPKVELPYDRNATIVRLSNLIKRVSYKPGWTFELLEPSETTAYVAVLFSAQDAFNPKELVEIGAKWECSIEWANRCTDEEFFTQFFAQLLEAEWHEACEWYLCDGDRVFNPHQKNSEKKGVRAAQSWLDNRAGL